MDRTPAVPRAILKTLRTSACLLALTAAPCAAGEDGAPDRSPRIVNIINFIRQCEPRIDWITEDVLYDTVVVADRDHEAASTEGHLSPAV